MTMSIRSSSPPVIEQPLSLVINNDGLEPLGQRMEEPDDHNVSFLISRFTEFIYCCARFFIIDSRYDMRTFLKENNVSSIAHWNLLSR
jgi:hypothetical protein